ncbi:TRAP transporter solute receptor, TAXI family [Rhizobiales bacterium GAS191]|nr:TRAP transporter solute receptor, TAXI family [Rhizobiales bacterium GAS113]SED33222.1 TRAP transporter solute receptor, TAXI family [Rhizobiales bacterium GAS188]SEE96291.1 TRAP transporter solute receptor, TAXI family [Rhizobiales bacterium GAS191]
MIIARAWGGCAIGGLIITPESRRTPGTLPARLLRSPFLWVPAAVLAAVLLAWGMRFIARPTVLRIAVGPEGSADVKLISDLAVQMARVKTRSLKLKLIKTTDVAQSAAALDAGRADLAVVRSDVSMSATGLTVAILHRNAVAFIAPRTSSVRNIADLDKKRVGILRATLENEHLLEQLLSEYGIAAQSVTQVPLEPEGLASAIRDRRIDAVMVVAPPSGTLMNAAVEAVASASKGEPVFVEVKEAEAIAERKPVYESHEIVNGLFGRNPPRPKASFKTLAVSYRLVASRDLEDYVVSDFTRRLFTLRMALSFDSSFADHIEKPDTDNDTALPLHPGAAAYFDGNEKSFFDRYDDWFYLGAMGLSGLVSGLAALIASARAWTRRGTLSAIDELIHIRVAARNAKDEAALEAAETAVAEISTVALRQARDGRIDDAGLSALSLAMDECRQAIADRRVRLAAQVASPLATDAAAVAPFTLS